MKYFKLALLSIGERFKTNLLIVLQLTFMLVLVNYMIGSMHSRSMLSDTYRSVLDKQGWYMQYNDFDEIDRLINQAAETGEDLSLPSAEEQLVGYLEQFDPKPEYKGICQASGWLEDGYYADIFILPDEWFDDLTLPVKSSSLGSNKLLVFSNKSGIGAGDEFRFKTTNQRWLTLKATGTLTDPAYIPRQTSWHRDGSIDMLYQKVSSSKDDQAFMITSVSAAESFGFEKSEMPMTSSTIVYYPDPIPEADYDRLTDKLQADGMNVGYTKLSDLKAAAESDLKEDLGKYVPLAVVVILIVVLGTAGAIAIQTLDEMKHYAILYLCGMKRKEAVLINLCKVMILLTASLAVSAAVMSVLQSQNIAADLGLSFGRTNLYVSLLLIALTLISSVMLPFILLRKNEPAELMRRIKND